MDSRRFGKWAYIILSAFAKDPDAKLYASQMAKTFGVTSGVFHHALMGLKKVGWLEQDEHVGNIKVWTLTDSGKEEGMRELERFNQQMREGGGF